MDPSAQLRFRPILEQRLRDLPGEDLIDETTAGELRRQRLRLEAALDRIERGFFGRCLQCGIVLPNRLLDQDPTVVHCGCERLKRKTQRFRMA